ncbi:hypothetical protein ACFWHQ_19970 [Streptomyces sp. NPDC060334]|uniref:hypothetical protein n=1 Tax=Streptomyces sp. NPDC060334 TaxID=3347099 RepID=UPI00364E7960
MHWAVKMLTPGEIKLSIAIFIILIICGYTANASHAEIAEPVFLAAITILVFLLPAAGIVGPYLVDEAVTATRLSVMDPTAGAALKESLGKILKSARWMRIGFPCTLAAIILSSVAMVGTGAVLHVCRPHGEIYVDRVLGGVALGLLISTSLSIFPMTRRLLQLSTVQRIYEQDNPAPNGRGDDQ